MRDVRVRGMEPRRGLAAVRAAGNAALLAVVRGVGDRAPTCLAVLRGAAKASGAAPSALWDRWSIYSGGQQGSEGIREHGL